MRVVSWNLAYMTPAKYKAHKNRYRQWNYIASLESDIVLLQECRPEDSMRYGLDDKYIIIGGDWNECRKFDQLHQYDPGSGKELFERTLKAGWRESLRRYHREEVQTYLKHGTGGYELDHLFTDAFLESRLTRCDVLKETPIPEISDHAAIIADFS